MLEPKNLKLAGGDNDGMQITSNSPFNPKSERQQKSAFSLLNNFKFIWIDLFHLFDKCYSTKAL